MADTKTLREMLEQLVDAYNSGRSDLIEKHLAKSRSWLADQAQMETFAFDTENPRCNDGGEACTDCICMGKCLAVPHPPTNPCALCGEQNTTLHECANGHQS